MINWCFRATFSVSVTALTNMVTSWIKDVKVKGFIYQRVFFESL